VGISTEDSFNISLWLQAESFSERPSGQTNANSAKLARTATSILANFLFMVCCQIERVEFTFFCCGNLVCEWMGISVWSRRFFTGCHTTAKKLAG
jgi:hypothetical protein